MPVVKLSGEELAEVKKTILGLLKSFGVSESEESRSCSDCGGGNAVREVAVAKTPSEVEQAIINA